MTEESKDAMAVFRAAMDQASGVVVEIAGLLGRYYGELCQAGLPGEHAILLVVEYQRQFIEPLAEKGDDS